MRRKNLVGMLLCLMLVFSLYGCAASPEELKGNEGAASGQELQDEKQSVGSGKVGLAMPTKANERWIREGEYMKTELEALGYEVDLQYAEDIVDTQVSQIENMLTGGVDVLVIAAVDGSTMSSALQTAKDKGVTVIAYDRLLTKTDCVDYFATFDSITIGELQGTALLNGLGVTDGEKGPFHIELFAGSLDDSNSPLYFEGAMNVLQPYVDEGVLVIASGQTALEQCATQNWDPLNAQARMDNLISAYYAGETKCDGVLSPYDGLSIGILSSFKSVGYGTGERPLPIVTGQDCELASVKSIIAGEQNSSIFNNTSLLSGVAIDMVDAVMKGEEVKTDNVYNNENIDVPSVSVSATIITIDNYKEELIDSGHISEADLQ